MKKLLASIATLLAFGTALAGPVVDKNPIYVDPSCECFVPGLNLSAFASGLAFEGGGGLDDSIGGGVGLTYFFTENLGLDYSYAVHATDSEKHINALDLIYRLPLGNSCLAPYLLGGGGLFTNGSNNGAWRLGGGLEYRLANCSAIFADATRNWVENEADATQIRLGMRFPF